MSRPDPLKIKHTTRNSAFSFIILRIAAIIMTSCAKTLKPSVADLMQRVMSLLFTSNYLEQNMFYNLVFFSV